MATKFQNKYRIPSARWQLWDYSSEGLYFITINTTQHACLFGTIANKEMYLSEFGQIVAEEWTKSIEIREELFCDSFVIMPNHIHAILRIEYPVETHGRASLPDANTNNACTGIHGRASVPDANANANNGYTETHSRASVHATKSIPAVQRRTAVRL